MNNGNKNIGNSELIALANRRREQMKKAEAERRPTPPPPQPQPQVQPQPKPQPKPQPVPDKKRERELQKKRAAAQKQKAAAEKQKREHNALSEYIRTSPLGARCVDWACKPGSVRFRAAIIYLHCGSLRSSSLAALPPCTIGGPPKSKTRARCCFG